MSEQNTVAKSQAEKAVKLQDLWLDRMVTLLETGIATSTDLATLSRVLLANGWSLDPRKLPKGLQDKLTQAVGGFDEEGAPRMRVVK